MPSHRSTKNINIENYLLLNAIINKTYTHHFPWEQFSIFKHLYFFSGPVQPKRWQLWSVRRQLRWPSSKRQRKHRKVRNRRNNCHLPSRQRHPCYRQSDCQPQRNVHLQVSVVESRSNKRSKFLFTYLLAACASWRILTHQNQRIASSTSPSLMVPTVSQYKRSNLFL